MGNKIIFAILLFSLSGLLVPVSFADVDYQEQAYRDDSTTQCREGQILVFRTAYNDYVCTDKITAQKWVRYGIAEIVGDVPEEPVEQEPVEGGTNHF